MVFGASAVYTLYDHTQRNEQDQMCGPGGRKGIGNKNKSIKATIAHK